MPLAGQLGKMAHAKKQSKCWLYLDRVNDQSGDIGNIALAWYAGKKNAGSHLSGRGFSIDMFLYGGIQ